MSRKLLRAMAGGLVGLALAVAASAHGPTTSYSSSVWRFGDDPEAVRVSLQARLSDLRLVAPALGGDSGALDAWLQSQLQLRRGSPCSAESASVPIPTADPRDHAREWSLRCPGQGAFELSVGIFFDALPGHVHVARIVLPGGDAYERVFVAGSEPTRLDAEGGGAQPGIGDYLRLGVVHIFAGLDHLAFLLALLLVATSVREVATLVTGFTVAHSFTLAAAVLQWIEPHASAVEALIGLSIVVVALENFALTSSRRLGRHIVASLALCGAAASVAAATGHLAVPTAALAGIVLFSVCYLLLQRHTPRPVRLRWFVALVFGGIHGFGFAGQLVELGVPAGRVAGSLLGFNLGVELGQLAIVIVCWPLLRAWVHQRPLAVQVGSSAVLAAGLFWFLERSLS